MLAARRVEPRALAGGWEFPGGKVEPGEDPVTALHRELDEELRVRVRLGAELPPPVRRRLADRGRPGDAALVRRGHRRSRRSPTDSHDELRWLTADELDDVSWLPADLAIIDRLRPLLDRPTRTA